MTVTDTGSNTSVNTVISGTMSVNGTSYGTGAGSRRTIYGIQVEEGATATSYIPTVASTVTRNADIVTLAGATALIGQTAGTMFAEMVYNATQATVGIFTDNPVLVIGINTSDMNAIWLRGTPTNRAISFTSTGGVVQSVIISPTPQSSGIVKIAYTYAANSFKLFVNGVKVGEDLSGTVPTGGNIFFGNYDASGATFTIRLNAASLEKIAISEAEAIALTTI